MRERCSQDSRARVFNALQRKLASARRVTAGYPMFLASLSTIDRSIDRPIESTDSNF
jgi:hypothetical protein